MTSNNGSFRGAGLFAVAGLCLQLIPVVVLAAPPEADLSQYREFHFGSDLPSVAKLADTNPSQAKVIHRRPALIQELEWRPRPLGSSPADPAKEVIFSFYDGQLFQIAIDYDRYRTEGMTSDDLIDAISKTYGKAAKLNEVSKGSGEQYGGQENHIAQWQDAEYRFDLIRFSYGPSFKLVGVLKKMEVSARTAIAESARLDEKEAPQREAARVATEDEAERAKLAKARLANKPAFKP